MKREKTVCLDVAMDVPIAWLADPQSFANITTYDDMAVIGFLDPHDTMRARGGSMSLIQAAWLLFPEEDK